MHMSMYTRNFLFVAYCCFLLTACGYGREDDKEASRKEDIQELQQEMEQYRLQIDSLKAQVSEEQTAAAGMETSPSEEDLHEILMAELQKAEAAHQVWKEELIPDAGTRNHDETMQHYDQKEQEAAMVRQEMMSAIQYVENELRE